MPETDKQPDTGTITITQQQLDAMLAGAVSKVLDGMKQEPAKTEAATAKEKLAADQEQARNRAEIETAVKFGITAKKFIEDNKNYLPAECQKLAEVVETKVYNSEQDKANALRKGILDSYLALQDNVDALPETLKSAAKSYQALTESEKLKQSANFWQIVDVGVNNKMLTSRAEQLAKAGGDVEQGAFEKRFFDLGKVFERN